MSTPMSTLLVPLQPVVAATPFAYERPSASLSDLDIVRKIVEREGCIEALQHLVASQACTTSDRGELDADAGYCYSGPGSVRRASTRAAGATAPLVVQSVVDQLRVVGVQIVEGIERWKQSASAQTFQWRGLNYLLKMTSDLDFLADSPHAAQLEPLHLLRLRGNPLLSALHLEHAALRDSTPDTALLLLGGSSGCIDTRRLFAAARALLLELLAERRRKHLGYLTDQFASMSEETEADEADLEPERQQLVTARVHWSHRPVTPSRSTSITKPISLEPDGAMRQEVELSRELLAQAEHELGAVRESLARLQKKLPNCSFSDQRRKMQTQIGALVNDIKFRSGDVYQRRNELRRKEAALRLRHTQRPSADPTILEAEDEEPSSPSVPQLPSLAELDDATLEAAIREDELRRHDLVEFFADRRVARLKPAGVDRQRAKSLSSPMQLQRPSSGGSIARSERPRSAVPAAGRTSTANIGHHPTGNLREFTIDQVASFVDALGLGMATPSYGALLKAQGIDGPLLVQATTSDLEELGVAVRLHRLRIVDAVQRALSAAAQ